MLTPNDYELIPKIARQSITHRLDTGEVLELDPATYPLALRNNGACFVTLESKGQLRGCIGSLQAYRPLLKDVIENAHAAAFRDPRFPALTKDELEQLSIHVSVLNPSTPLHVSSEQSLYEQLAPHEDGLILEYRQHKATFLPSVWDQLPQPQEFVRQLKLKAGLPAHFWNDDMQFWRYTVTLIDE